jgi:hypothetical protein
MADEIFRPYWPFDEMDIPLTQLNAGFSAEGLCYHNLLIEQDEECISVAVAPIYAWVEHLPVDYENADEFTEDGYGNQKLISRSVTPVPGFSVIVDEYMKKFFYELFYSSEFVNLTDPDAVSPIKVFGAEIESETLDSGLYRLTIRYKTNEQGGGVFGSVSCCRPIYEEAPYEDVCPGDSGEGEGEGEPVDCSGFDVTVEREDDTLTAVVAGDPGGTIITWLFRPNETSPWVTLIVNATSISLGAFGIYRAVANNPNCDTKIDQYLYQDACGGLSVTLEQVGSAIHATLTGDCEEGTYQWEFYNEETNTWGILEETTHILMATTPGLYHVTFTCTATECEADAMIEFTENVECDFTATIALEDDILTVTVEDCEDTPTFVWKLDNGTSLVTLPGTSNTLQTTESGNYIAEVTCGDCTLTVSKVVIVEPEDCCDLSISINSNEITEGVGTLYAVITTTEDTDGITVNWDIQTPQGYVPYEHGTMSTAISEQGSFRLTVTLANGCQRVRYYFNSNCLECEEFEVTITEDGGVFTASVDCDTPTFNWIRMDQDGDHETGITTASITPTLPGLYIVTVNCGGCESTGRFIAYECECLEVFIPGSAVPIAVCAGE